jgi:hypothetical protein
MQRIRITVLLVFTTLTGCGEDPASITAEPAETVTAVEVSPATAELRVGETATFSARVISNLGRELTGQTIQWSSGDTLAIQVHSAGVATAIAPGAAVPIRATVAGVSGEARVSVFPLVQTVELTPSTLDLMTGDTARVEVRLLDHRGDPVLGQIVEWSSDVPGAASVDESGLVTARSPGSTRIRARAAGTEGTLAATVAGRTPALPGLVHRWTFSERGGAGTILRDDIGGAEARLVGAGQFEGRVGGGRAILPGGTRDTAGYIELPSGLISRFENATIELWATQNEVRNWARVFDFGDGPANNLFISWSTGTTYGSNRSAVTVNGTEYRRDDTMAPFLLGYPHHIVLTITAGAGAAGATRFALYLDGEPRGFFDAPLSLRDFPDSHAWLGRSSHTGDETASASYDELRIHDRSYSASEVRALFQEGGEPYGGLQSLEILPPPGAEDRIRGVGVEFNLRAVGRDEMGDDSAVWGVTWASSDPGVLSVTPDGTLQTHREGRATISAALEGLTASWEVEVVRSLRVPVSAELATPAPGAQWEIPVILVGYIPTADGVNGDIRKAPDFWWLNPLSLDSIQTRCLEYTRRRKMMAEEGSRFRGYKDPAALPALGYRIVEQLFVYEHPPATSKRASHGGWFVDYDRILRSDGILDRIRNEGVREVWLCDSHFDPGFPSFDPAIHDPADARAGWESNMSSPTSGDISNSDRDPNDLPVVDHTYIVYGIAYRRSQAEAMHNVGHQMEAMMSYAAWRQTGSDLFFWRDFVGFVGQTHPLQPGVGRAGWTHMPPNTTGNYDYHNPTPVLADIEDWRPDGTGEKKLISRSTWYNLVYPWPGAQEFGQREESQWYVYWMQNFPGRGNRIPHPNGWMTNWWAFVGDWDAAVRSGLGLYGSQPAAVQGQTGEGARAMGPPRRVHENDARWPVREDPARGRTRPPPGG